MLICTLTHRRRAMAALVPPEVRSLRVESRKLASFCFLNRHARLVATGNAECLPGVPQTNPGAASARVAGTDRSNCTRFWGVYYLLYLFCFFLVSQVVAKRLAARLSALGAKELLPTGLGDDQVRVPEVVDAGRAPRGNRHTTSSKTLKPAECS